MKPKIKKKTKQRLKINELEQITGGIAGIRGSFGKGGFGTKN